MLREYDVSPDPKPLATFVPVYRNWAGASLAEMRKLKAVFQNPDHPVARKSSAGPRRAETAQITLSFVKTTSCLAKRGAAIEHVYDWVNGTPEDDWTSVAMPSDGSYGVAEGVICSSPAVSRDGKWEIVHGLDTAADTWAKIDAFVAEHVGERDAFGQLERI